MVLQFSFRIFIGHRQLSAYLWRAQNGIVWYHIISYESHEDTSIDIPIRHCLYLLYYDIPPNHTYYGLSFCLYIYYDTIFQYILSTLIIHLSSCLYILISCLRVSFYKLCFWLDCTHLISLYTEATLLTKSIYQVYNIMYNLSKSEAILSFDCHSINFLQIYI